MNWLFTEELIFLMLWQSHNSFYNEFLQANKKIRNLEAGFTIAKKLLAKQFDPSSPVAVISPGKIHRLHGESTWELWKLEMVVQNLRPNQFPRIWFAVSGEVITFLALGCHVKNYDDNERQRVALERFSDIS